MPFQPKIRHLENPEDLNILPKLVQNFSKQVTNKMLEDITKLNGWKNPEKLLEYRKELLAVVKEACLERKDQVTASLKKGEIDKRNDPYLKAALLCALISWHCDEQLREIQSNF